MIILAIETSCDDTAVSILKDHKVLSNIIHTQKSHNKTGGVIPEIASREHSQKIFDVIKQALVVAKVKIFDITHIAVTQGPGLINSLQVGLVVAKTLSMILKVPVYGINHLQAHAFSPFVNEKKIPFTKFISVIVSGGHTILSVYENDKYKIFGETLDDSIGECFDKIAKKLWKIYPGGQKIDEIFNEYKGEYIPINTYKKDDYNFSYSGVKSSLINLIDTKKYSKNQVAASLQKHLVDDLSNKVIKLSKEKKIQNVVFGGGVSSNSYLRKAFTNEKKLNVFFPKSEYAVDNAAMIGYLLFAKQKKLKPMKLDADSNPNIKVIE